MDSLDNVKHGKFKYIFIPRDIQDDVQVFEFEGFERNFKSKLQNHFAQEKLLDREKVELSKTLSGSTGQHRVDQQYMDRAVEVAQTYQIIPLTLPTMKNNYDGVNAYIDSVSRIKNLPTNARATRIIGEDIRGDCFISRTFDDETVFKRIDFTMDDYKAFLENPPDRSRRWNQTEALMKLQQEMAGGNREASELPSSTAAEPSHCSNCRKSSLLKKCGRCKKVHFKLVL